MKNKQVKQMICSVLDKKYGRKYPLNHFFEESSGLCECYFSCCGHDDCVVDCDSMILGVASLTANQLKGE